LRYDQKYIFVFTQSYRCCCVTLIKLEISQQIFQVGISCKEANWSSTIASRQTWCR